MPKKTAPKPQDPNERVRLTVFVPQWLHTAMKVDKATNGTLMEDMILDWGRARYPAAARTAAARK